ncbi:single-stranded DNA-binding protein [Brevibacillus sp. AG]|uniref:single-stranded DNA-binding protein n=1 Tax=Brevibacillus sp. AG TaxID=3020891 RepID=UPI0023313F57|nr:single-stranded DNA-binding protein [Brevibacillus sp. AG]MDC0763458.1 single-stranded DNA-binding protein [Brevibacillus sp. AG]
MNKIILIGNLTKDPELRFTPNGVAVCTFTLAVNRPRRGEQQETDYINIVVWQKLGERAAEYLGKGRKCAVEGRMQIRNYDNKEGQKVYVTEVIAESIEFLGGRGEKREQQSQQSDPPADPFGDPFATAGKPINISDDDLPF